MPELPRHTVMRLYAEALNQRRLELINELVAEDVVWSVPPLAPIHGRPAVLESVRGFLNAFPDVHYFVDRIVAQEDQVTVCWHTTATHLGDFLGVPGTGKPAPSSGITWYRVEAGLIAEASGVFDALGLLQSIGAAPPLGQSPRYEAIKTAFAFYGKFFLEVAKEVGLDRALALNAAHGREMGAFIASLIDARAAGRPPDTRTLAAAVREYYDVMGVSYSATQQPGKVVMAATRCPIYDGLAAAGLSHDEIQALCTAISGAEHAALHDCCSAVAASLDFRSTAQAPCVEEFALVN